MSESLSEQLNLNMPGQTIPDWDVNRVKRFIRKVKDDIVKNDIYTADEIFRVINDNAGEDLV